MVDKRDKNGRFKKGQLAWNKKEPIISHCIACELIIETPPSIKRRYCSYDCYWESKVGTKASLSTRKKMRDSAKKGSESPNWKGGRSRGYKTGYYSAEYKEWRISVFERDGYQCQGCKIVGGYLTAHHIKGFAHYPKLRFKIDNGVTLCEECHKMTDNYKGRGRNA